MRNNKFLAMIACLSVTACISAESVNFSGEISVTNDTDTIIIIKTIPGSTQLENITFTPRTYRIEAGKTTNVSIHGDGFHILSFPLQQGNLFEARIKRNGIWNVTNEKQEQGFGTLSGTQAVNGQAIKISGAKAQGYKLDLVVS